MMDENPNKPESEELLRQISAFHDGELNPQEARRLETRLAADEAARAARQELEALDALLGQWPAPPAVDLRPAVMGRVRRELERTVTRRARNWRWSTLAWAATWMMGGVLTGLTLWSGVDQRINEEIAAENMSQDMTLSMIMTEDWTPPIAIEEDVQP